MCREKWTEVSENMETRAFSLYIVIIVHCEWCLSRTPSPLLSSYSYLFLPSFSIHPEPEVKKFGLSLRLNFMSSRRGGFGAEKSEGMMGGWGRRGEDKREESMNQGRDTDSHRFSLSFSLLLVFVGSSLPPLCFFKNKSKKSI